MAIKKETFDCVRDLVLERSAIVLADSKSYLVEARLKPVCDAEGFGSIDELAQALGSKPTKLVDKVVDALTTNETSFFRDINPFKKLENEILPRLIETNAASKTIDIWSAASSSGQEPLSIAMTLRENDRLRSWKVRIIATDICTAMLERCKAGRYSELEVSRGLPEELRERYFKRDGNAWVVKGEILNMIEYRRMNLADRFPPMPPLDLVFMRNVLIYFDAETKGQILRQTHKALKPSGELFLGTAESASSFKEGFQSSTEGGTTSFRPAA